MAQSVKDLRKTPLHVEAFWDKSTISPPLSSEKWTTQWKLKNLAKEGIHLETLLDCPAAGVDYPPKQTYDEALDGHIQSTERDPKINNQQWKVIRQNRCKKVEDIRILYGDKPSETCDQEEKYLLNLSI